MMELKKLYSIFQESKHGEWIVDFGDYETLGTYIRANKNKRVLELGGGVGCLTALISNSMEADGHVHSVEAFPKCTALAKRLIPEELQHKITFHTQPVAVCSIRGIHDRNFLTYKELPEDDYDLVVIDGPGPAYMQQGEDKAVGYLFDLPGGDFFHLIDKTKEGTVFYIDGRREMVRVMLRFFSSYFKVIQSTDGVTILMRIGEPKDGMIEMRDTLFDDLASRGYFKNDEDFISGN